MAVFNGNRIIYEHNTATVNTDVKCCNPLYIPHTSQFIIHYIHPLDTIIFAVLKYRCQNSIRSEDKTELFPVGVCMYTKFYDEGSLTNAHVKILTPFQNKFGMFCDLRFSDFDELRQLY
jgi:hypothetical protein